MRNHPEKLEGILHNNAEDYAKISLLPVMDICGLYLKGENINHRGLEECKKEAIKHLKKEYDSSMKILTPEKSGYLIERGIRIFDNKFKFVMKKIFIEDYAEEYIKSSEPQELIERTCHIIEDKIFTGAGFVKEGDRYAMRFRW